MITEERKAALYDLWLTETNEDYTQEWREELTEEEQALVSAWDDACPL